VEKKKKKIKEILNWAVSYLKERGVDSPRINAELIAEKIIGRSRISLYLEPDFLVEDEVLAKFEKEIKRRGRRVPVEYIVGEKHFMDLKLIVSPGVYIPRPETEILVEEALRILKKLKSPASILRVVDLGTGTGNIAISIAKKFQAIKIYTIDLSFKAIKVAKMNARLNRVEKKIDFLVGDLFSPLQGKKLEGKIDLIVSNPPYVDRKKLKELPPEVKKEPDFALNGGPGGLSFYKRIIPGSLIWLKNGGWLLLEIGYDQDKKVTQLLQSEKRLSLCRIVKDFNGNPRAIIVQKTS